jgi:hypothetical protein
MPPLAGAQILRRAQWPSVRLNKSGAAEAGPTGAPWINSNGWLIRIARHLDPARPAVVDTKPPAGARPASHVLAVADAMTYGGAWVVTHSPVSWQPVQTALRFFAAHAEWRDWPPVAAVAVVSRFTGDDEWIGEEALNLLARRQVGCRLAAPGDVDSLGEVRAAAWASRLSVPYEKYLPWVRAGGTLIVQGESASRVEGRGRVVGRPEGWEDPYAAVAGIHLALTRRTDVLRLWNAGSFNSFSQQEPGGRRGVVHLVNYGANQSSDDASIWLARPWSRAVLRTLHTQSPLKMRTVNGGIEMSLPPLGVYAAIDLEA